MEAIPGYTCRPATMDDVDAVANLLNTCAIALTGKPTAVAGEMRSEWQLPRVSLAEDTRLVLAPDGALAGFAHYWGSEPFVDSYVTADVHPEHRGRGIGTALARWLDTRGRQAIPAALEDARVILWQFVRSTHEAAGKLLLDQGYRIARYNLRMAIDFNGPPPAPILPAGLIIRPFIRGQEERELVLAVREEFRDHWGYVESPFEEDYQEWLHWMETGPTCDPSLFFVAVDGDRIAGTALCQAQWPEDPDTGWIFALGVKRPWRRRGLARALLQHCFVALHGRGKRRAGLGVDAESLTGALRLYESAGMHDEVEHRFIRYEKELRPGRDLSTQAVV